MFGYWCSTSTSSRARGSVATTSSAVRRSSATCSASALVVEVAHDRPDRRLPGRRLDRVDVDEALALGRRLRRQPVLRQRGQHAPGQPRGVDELAGREAGMDLDAVDRQVGRRCGERLVGELARLGAVERVRAGGAEPLDVEQLRALADLLVGREADPHASRAAARGARRGRRPRPSPPPCRPCRRRPSSVSPLVVTMSWPTFGVSSGIRAGSSTVPRARQRRSRRRRSRGARAARRPSPDSSGLVSRWASRPITGAPGDVARRASR